MCSEYSAPDPAGLFHNRLMINERSVQVVLRAMTTIRFFREAIGLVTHVARGDF